MRFLQLLKISVDSFCRRRWMRFFLSALCGASFFLVAFALLQILSAYSAVARYSSSIAGNHSRILLITEDALLDSPEVESMWSSFQTALQDEFPESGAFSDSFGYFEELRLNEQYLSVNASQSVDVLLRDSPFGTRLLSVDATILSLGKLSLRSSAREAFRKNNAKRPLLVGYAYKDVLPLGTVLTRNNEKYEVVGVLSPGAEWPSTDGITTASASVISLDYCFVYPHKAEDYSIAFGYRSTFVITEKSQCDAAALVFELARKEGISVSVQTVSEYIAAEKELIHDSMSGILRLSGFMLILSLLLVIMTNLMDIMMRQREFGILYSCGFTGREIKGLILLDTLLFTFSSLLFYFMIKTLFCRFQSISWKEQLQYIKRPFFLAFLCIIVVMEAASLLFSIAYLNRKSPTELLEDRG